MTFKQHEYDKNDDMVIHTGHKTFDRQTNCITHGNITANTMRGCHVRAFTETKCGWKDDERKPGELQDFDLQSMIDDFRQSGYRHIFKSVKESLREKQGWLYAFYHYQHSRRENRMVRIIHGFILTTYDHQLLKSWVVGPCWQKSFDVIEECKKYVCDQGGVSQEMAEATHLTVLNQEG